MISQKKIDGLAATPINKEFQIRPGFVVIPTVATSDSHCFNDCAFRVDNKECPTLVGDQSGWCLGYDPYTYDGIDCYFKRCASKKRG